MGISILKPKSTDDILDSMKNANPSYVLKNSLSRKFLNGVILALKSGSEFSPMEWDDLYTFLSTNRDEFNSSRPSQKFLDKLLKKAAQRPFVDLVKYAIDKGANVNSNDRMGNTALYYAAKAQCLESLKALVKSGANVNAVNRTGSTPLIASAKPFGVKLNREVFWFLVENGANVHHKNNAGFSAVDIAPNSLKHEVFQRLNVTPSEDVIKSALREGTLKLFMNLLDKGHIDPKGSIDGEPVINLVDLSMPASVAKVKALLDRGAKLDDRFKHKLSSVMSYLNSYSKDNPLKTQWEKFIKDHILHESFSVKGSIFAPKDNDDIKRELDKLHPNTIIDIISSAILGKDSEAAIYAIKNVLGRSDMTTLPSRSLAQTPMTRVLHTAIVWNDAKVTNFLLKSNAVSQYGKDTALELVCSARPLGRIELAKMLIDHGADVNFMEGIALAKACDAGELGLAKIILDAGVNINAREEILVNAINKANWRLVKMLVDYNAKFTDYVMSFTNFSKQDVERQIAFMNESYTNSIFEPKRPSDIKSILNNDENHDRIINILSAYASSNDINELSKLVKQGLDIEKYFNQKNYVVLRQAVYSNSIGVIKYMFSVGAKLPTDELLIREMLNHTVGSSNMRMLRLLMSKGARPVDFHLHLASARGFVDIVNAIIDNGIRPDGKSLGLAAKNWHTGTAILLVRRGASIDDAMDYILAETSVSPDSTIIEFLKSLKHNEKA